MIVATVIVCLLLIGVVCAVAGQKRGRTWLEFYYRLGFRPRPKHRPLDPEHPFRARSTFFGADLNRWLRRRR